MAGGIESDDENLSNSQLAYIISYYRAKLLKQDQDQGRMLNTLYVQNLGKVPLQMADKNECCDIDACILRTVDKMPSPLETYKGLNITFVGTYQGRPFTMKNHNATIFKKGAKWTAKEPTWYYQNGYIYLVDPPTKMISHVNIQGIFEDPLVAEEFRTCDCLNEEDCFKGFDLEYPMPMHKVDIIVKLIAETELRILTSIPADTSNDSQGQVEGLRKQGVDG